MQQTQGVFFVVAAGCLANPLLPLLSLKLLAKVTQTPFLEHRVFAHNTKEVGHRFDNGRGFISLI